MCVIFFEIYIFQIKADSFFATPAIPRAIWILEWLFMLTAAGIVGLAIGWQLREKPLRVCFRQMREFEKEREALISKYNHLVDEKNKIAHRLVRAQQSFKQDYKQWQKDKDRLRQELSSSKTLEDTLKAEQATLKRQVELAQREKESALHNLATLQPKLEKVQSERDLLEAKVAKTATRPPKDNLQLIKGIGPTIEKKLNAIGINSYHQISAFTPEMVEEVTKAIKFFPRRIEKDNWISQARVLEEERKQQTQQPPLG
jgi:predicted flap endonuclease-1-like 5' DNA nuclease